MRLLTTSPDPHFMQQISDYLRSVGIENEVDGQKNSDWGSSDYGTINYTLWVIDEDQAEKAYQLYEQFVASPPPLLPKIVPNIAPKDEKVIPFPKREHPKSLSTPITHFLIIVCTLLYFWSAFTTPEYKSTTDASLTYSPVFSSPVRQELLYDFPKAYELLIQIVDQYGVDALKDPQSLPPAGNALVQKFENTPYWRGLYEDVIAYFLNSVPPDKEAPLFEKIREGQVWRIITPIFLHGDIFHILFNMLWLFVLGKQLELHLGKLRYILFILIAAAITNTAQYLISGPNFLGFSGVLVAFLTFIWLRQREAPWEGYQLQRSTFVFIMLFIFGMFALSLLSFVVEIATGTAFAGYIANTAHLTGALVGLLFGKIPFFTKERWAA